MAKELTFLQLKNNYNLETLDNIEPYKGLIGQERAEKAIKFGLNIKKPGYNLFVCGEEGIGKINFAKKFAEEFAKNEPIPNDLCYIYNFKNPKEAKSLSLKAGLGNILKNEMDELINKILTELPKAFQNKNFEDKKNKTYKTFQKKRDGLLKIITNEAKKRNFGVESTNQGIYFMPLVDDEIISEEQYDLLSDDEKDNISKISDEIQGYASNIIDRLKSLELETKRILTDLEYSESLFLIGHHIGLLIEKYSENKDIIEYLNDVKEDILDNLNNFIEDDEPEDDALYSMLPWYNKKNNFEHLNKYKINLLVDNKDLKSAPVIIDYNPTYIKLIGELEYDSEYGNLSTDFMKMKPGLFHQANGGYLILKAYDVLTNINSWETIRRVLKIKKITIEPLKEYSTGLVVSYIKPEAIDLNIKIILVGSNYYYDFLNYYDDEFKDLFKIKADFDFEMDSSNDNIIKNLGFMKNFVKEENLLEFKSDALIKVLECSQRLAENQKKLTANFSTLSDILIESSSWAIIDNQKFVCKSSVEKAINEKIYRHSLYEEKLDEMLVNNTIIVDTIGYKIGQINGLAVLESDDYIFGKPTKITATTFLGESGVINIEDEARMSGNIHHKGVLVLSGYIGQKYSQDFPLSLTCSVCFEQNYNGIDGDSASSTELYAILSSLSEIPINQEIAVTGSLNQFGDIQPIGGVTYKIEGFYDLCKKRGLTGNQGVIIPFQNISDLVLKDEVIESVKNKEFHIYPITHIDEGIEILTGIKAGNINSNKKYPKDSVHGKAYEKLKKYYKLTSDSSK